MSSSQNTSILHMTLQVPELLKSNATNVDDVGRCDNGGFRVRTRKLRAQRHNEVEEVLVKSEQTQETLRNRGGLVRLGRRGRRGHGLVVCGHVLAVQMLDLENIDGNTAAVSTTGPLRILDKSMLTTIAIHV